MRSVLALLTLTLLGMLSACGATASASTAEPTPLPATQIESGVIAEGKVVPAAFVNLSFTSSGTVAELLVAEGDQVPAGAPLARLDTRELELRLRQAEASYAQASATYADLQAGATPEQVAAAQARLSQARASAAQTRGSVTEADLAQAQAQLAQAEARLNQLLAGPKSTELTRAQAEVDAAQANLQAQRAALSLAKTNATSAAEQVANQLREAQDAYSRIYWQNRDLETHADLPQIAIDIEASARRAVHDAELGLSQARAAADQASQAERDGIASVEARLRAAQASLTQTSAGADPDVIAGARAQLAQAQAGLEKLQGLQRQSSLSAAQAAVDVANAQLAELSAGATESALAVQQARVHAAEADRDLAKLKLDQASLTAPFAGTVAQLNLKVGEPPPTGSPALVLADMAHWQVETADLTELSVAQVQVGDTAQLRFDAIADLSLPATVTQIKPIGQNRQGDIVYTVVLTPSSWDERLRWNMTASVQIGEK